MTTLQLVPATGALQCGSTITCLMQVPSQYDWNNVKETLTLSTNKQNFTVNVAFWSYDATGDQPLRFIGGEHDQSIYKFKLTFTICENGSNRETNITLFVPSYGKLRNVPASTGLTLRPTIKFASAKFLICFNFLSASILHRLVENVICLHNYHGILVVLGELRANTCACTGW